MKASTAGRMFFAVACAGALGFGLTACAGGNSAAEDSNAVAATINGTEIKEQKVTDYIQNFRTAQQVTEDKAWGEWLKQYNMTPSQVREDVIDYFSREELLTQAADEKGITVNEDDVDTQVQEMKANYDTDEAWQKALADAGTSEDEYRSNVRTAMLEQALEEKIIEEQGAEVTDEALLEQCKDYVQYFNGAKKSSHILFDAEDKDKAQETLDKINSGELDFAQAAKEFSQDTGSAENGGDVGWDMLNSFVTQYTDALAELDEGQTSGLVTSDYGIHIIRCTEKYTAPEELTSLDQVPAELLEYVRTMAKSTAESEAYNTWYESYKEAADIKINDMPAGLPYDIDPKLYETSSSSSEATSDIEVIEDEATSETTSETTEGTGDTHTETATVGGETVEATVEDKDPAAAA